MLGGSPTHSLPRFRSWCQLWMPGSWSGVAATCRRDYHRPKLPEGNTIKTAFIKTALHRPCFKRTSAKDTICLAKHIAPFRTESTSLPPTHLVKVQSNKLIGKNIFQIFFFPVDFFRAIFFQIVFFQSSCFPAIFFQSYLFKSFFSRRIFLCTVVLDQCYQRPSRR